jgi:ankyrin repeat protein
MGSVVTSAPEMVRLLLERGADPNMRNGGGITPAMQFADLYYFKKVYARPPYSDAPVPSPSPYHELHFVPIMELLVEHGADLSLRDDEGRGVLDYLHPDDDHDYAYKRAWLERLGAAPPAAVPSPRRS